MQHTEHDRTDEREPVIYMSEPVAILSPRRVLMRNKVTGRSVIVDRAAARIAARCDTLATPEQHCKRAQLAVSEDPAAAQRCVQTALDTGLFVTRDYLASYLRHPLAGKRPESRIDVVGIPTCNRPHMLDRVLNSLIGHMRAHGRNATVLVLDDSRTPAMQAANAAVIANRQRNSSIVIRHIDDTARDSYIDQLEHDIGLKPGALRFGCARNDSYCSTAGAARNMLLLLSCGRGALFLDDDHLCQVIAIPDATNRVKLANETMIRRFLASTEDVEDSLYVTEDILGLHERMLNFKIPALAWDTDQLNDAQGLASETYRRLGRENLRIITSQMGIFGDCGVDDPLSHILAEDSEWRELVKDPSAYTNAMRGRLVLTGTREFLITPRIHSQAGCLAVDNSNGLPPFLPVMRGEDVVFGLLIRICAPEGLFGFLPRAIVHSPDTSREFAEGAALKRAGRFSFAETINLLLTGAGGVWGDDFGERMRLLGRSLRNLMTAGDDELRDYLHRIVDPILINWIQRLEQRLDGANRQLPWAAELSAVQNRLLAGLDTFDPLQPFDLEPGSTTGSTPSAVLRTAVTAFSELLELWPAVLDHVQRHPLE